MLIVRVGGAGLALALSCLNAFGQTSQIAAVSGRDQLALHDLATGAELTRFDAPGGSSDLVALAYVVVHEDRKKLRRAGWFLPLPVS